MSGDIVLVGGGGHCISVIEIIEAEKRFRMAGIVDVAEKKGENVGGYRVMATDEDIPRLAKEYKQFLITLGQIETPKLRMRLYETVKQSGGSMPTVISPTAFVSRRASLGEGTIVMHQAMINARAKVGNNCIVNTKALIEHDVIVGDHCHVATAAVVNGGVHIREGVFVGSNAVVREEVSIGREAVIGCGLTILEDIGDKEMFVGRCK